LTPLQVLTQFFGFNEFRPGQKEIIDSILTGENVLAVLPTGGGKSLCYQIPALMSNSFSVVVSPLIALMKDQVDSINSKQKVAAFINSTLELRDIYKVLNEIEQGDIKLLYVSPEKLNSITFCESIKKLNPSYLFVDEAHCISEWGHSFRPSYRKIKSFIDIIGFSSIAAFTATATEDVRNDIVEQLGMQAPRVFVKGFERENLFLNVIHTSSKKEKLLNILKHHELPGIIYTATRKSAEEVTEYLRINGMDAVFYHAGVVPELRRIIQDDFQKNRVKLIVATNAFGMGIDKSDIRTLIHYNLTANIENYYQEIGRAGRDGNDSNVFLFYDDNDKSIQEYFIKNSFPTREQIELVYNTICDYASIALGNAYTKEIPLDKNITSFLESKDVTKGLLESSIKILGDSNYVFSDVRIKKHYIQSLFEPKGMQKYLKNLDDNDSKDLLLLLTREYGSTFFRAKTAINLSHLSQLIGESIEQISSVLKSLSLSGIILYEIPSTFPTVKLSGERIKSEDLKLNYERTKKIVLNSRDKLEKMISFVFTKECRFKYILNYFGQTENNYKCGKCDVCRGIHFEISPGSQFIEEQILEMLKDLGGSIAKRDLINLLMGKSTDEKKQNLNMFGSCKHFSKKEIEESINYLLYEKNIIINKNLIELNTINPESQDESILSNNNYESELQIFNMMRQIRKEAALRYNQPIELICSDEILREISHNRPKSASELFEIKGFNQRMFNKIGVELLELLKESESDFSLKELVKKKNLPENIIQVVELIKKKYSLNDISKITKLSDTLLSIQIESLLGMIPELEIDHLFEKNELDLINRKIDDGIKDLKLLKETLNNKFGYPLLRIALAKRKATR